MRTIVMMNGLGYDDRDYLGYVQVEEEYFDAVKVAADSIYDEWMRYERNRWRTGHHTDRFRDTLGMLKERLEKNGIPAIVEEFTDEMSLGYSY